MKTGQAILPCRASLLQAGLVVGIIGGTGSDTYSPDYIPFFSLASETHSPSRAKEKTTRSSLAGDGPAGYITLSTLPFDFTISIFEIIEQQNNITRDKRTKRISPRSRGEEERSPPQKS